MHILNASSGSVGSCVGAQLYTGVCSADMIKEAVVQTVYSLPAVSVHVSTLHKTVLKCTDSEQMLTGMIEGVSRLDRIRNADQKGRLNQEGSLNYVRRWQHNRKQRLEEMSSGRVTKFMMVRSQQSFVKT